VISFRKYLVTPATIALAGAILLGYAYFIEPNRLVIKHDEIAVRDWNPAFDGFRIVLLGDIHGGSNGVTEARLREIVERTNQEEPDLVVMLGDYVSQVRDRRPPRERDLLMPVSTIFDNLAGLRAKYGVYAVLGNHDGWYGGDQVAAEITRVGYRVLRNEVATIDRDGHKLRILGIRDHLELTGGWVRTAADLKTIADSSGPGDLIVLEHSPDILPVITGERLISADLRLFLAAHTHGGQVWLPIFGSAVVPSSYGQKYAYGHVRDNDTDMYVTSGIGTSVLPIRLMVPPEIVVLTIRRKGE
jgi:uncharacterized protein